MWYVEYIMSTIMIELRSIQNTVQLVVGFHHVLTCVVRQADDLHVVLHFSICRER